MESGCRTRRYATAVRLDERCFEKRGHVRWSAPSPDAGEGDPAMRLGGRGRNHFAANGAVGRRAVVNRRRPRLHDARGGRSLPLNVLAGWPDALAPGPAGSDEQPFGAE
jgi:hypothetical protein